MMYPWDQLDPQFNSTLRLVHEAAVRGHTVAVTGGSHLTVRDSVLSAFCKVIRKGNFQKSTPQSFHRNVVFKKALLPLAGFDVIVLRENPQKNNFALHFLESIKSEVFIFNDIEGIRLGSNKLYTLSFAESQQNYIPTTHVSKSKTYLESALEESPSERMILKPLVGYGGQGVILVEKSAIHNFRSLLDYYIDDENKGSYVILQEYVEGAEKGDVRVLMLNGEPIGAMKRVPNSKDHRSNVHAGAEVFKHVLTKHEKLLCAHIGPKLVQDGLYFVGVDIIEGKLIEVNVCSPGGITRINRLNRVKLQQNVLNFIENIVAAKDLIAHRKNLFRKAIEDVDSNDSANP